MAMTECSECGQEVSTNADECPQCGNRMRRRNRDSCMGCILIGVILIMVMTVFSYAATSI